MDICYVLLNLRWMFYLSNGFKCGLSCLDVSFGIVVSNWENNQFPFLLFFWFKFLSAVMRKLWSVLNLSSSLIACCCCLFL